jgi:organic radical activating enzyme
VKGRITEIFESIQGEGIYLGARQLFVRFFGCNLSCEFCDTKLDTFSEYAPEELLEELKQHEGNYHSISFTGGEPLLQKDFLKETLKLTKVSGFRNYLETNGTLPDTLREIIEYVDIVAMDLKLPSSTGLNNFWDAHRKFLELASQKEVFLKAVICQSTLEKDLDEAIKLIKEVNKNAIFVLQPNSYEDYNQLSEKLENFKDICAKENISARIICQMHKIVGIK